jgi:hypothetical protein
MPYTNTARCDSSTETPPGSRGSEGRELARVRPLCLFDHTPYDQRRAIVLSRGLGDRGAHVRTTAGATSQDVRSAIDAFQPSVVLACGPDAAAAMRHQAPVLPVLRVAGPENALAAWPPPIPGRREVLLWAGEAERAPRSAMPFLAIGPLEPESDAVGLVANLIGAAREAALYRRPLPLTGSLLERDLFVDFLCSIGPPSLRSPGLVGAMLDAAEALGMPAWTTASGMVYHRGLSWQWLFENWPSFFEAEKRAHREVRVHAGWVPEKRAPLHPACLGKQRLLASPTALRVSVRLEARLDGELRTQRMRAFLPAPLSLDAQTGVALVDASHPEVRAAFHTELGYIYGAELPGGESRLLLEASFDVTRYETRTVGLEQPGSRAPEEASEATLIAAASSQADPYARAFTIYEWIIRTCRYEKIATACACGECSARAMFERRAGHCITCSHAFVHLCGLAGVRARPVRGVMFTYVRDAERGVYGCSVPVEPVIGHTWAEFEVPGVGWLPVEFDPLVVKAASRRNCVDPELLAQLGGDFAFYARIYFGNLDAQRVVFSNSVLSIPWLVALDPRRPRGSRWTPVDSKRIRYTVEVSRQ